MNISFIMMAKNEALRISDALNSFKEIKGLSYEVLVIDDHSEDDTFQVVKKISENNNNIKLYKNKYKGKVLGTNYGYELSIGQYIKCIDADDVLCKDYFETLLGLMSKGFDAHCHGAEIVSNDLTLMSRYNVNKSIVKGDYKLIVENLVSIPKWSWTISRTVADKVFPIPRELLIEDIWISANIKRYAAKIYYDDKPLYLYRQHAGQDYGGILNFNKEINKTRAKRSLNFIEYMETNQSSEDFDFKEIKKYSNLIYRNGTLLDIVTSSLPLKSRIKLIFLMKQPRFYSMLTKLKWYYDGILGK
jgi:glycosyltransferase involved in cell wall biosynthesis